MSLCVNYIFILNTINIRGEAPSDGSGSCLRRRSEAEPSSLAAEGGRCFAPYVNDIVFILNNLYYLFSKYKTINAGARIRSAQRANNIVMPVSSPK